jgi:demethylmenaquinone methyltransferase/2-methoxy-6-polyprenyl-1,4-benzoquinol methylase
MWENTDKLHMNTKPTLTDYYARRALEYERIYHKPERQTDLGRLRGMVADAFASLDVFELACGTGYWTEILSKASASLLATDINEEVLAIARCKPIDFGKTGFGNVDAYHLPEFEKRFNGGFSGFWWSHVPKARLNEFLTGFHRIFDPGSRIVFIDNRYVQGNSTPITRQNADGDTFQTRHLDDGSAYEVIKNFPTETELKNAVEPFAKEVRVEFLEYYWLLSYRLK